VRALPIILRNAPVPALRELARDPDVTVEARDVLSFIGVPEDLRLIMQLAPPPLKGYTFPDRWRYNVVTAVLNPESEDEWTFLRRCALNEFGDRWVDDGAIQTLKLIASPRSREILEEAQMRNSGRPLSIARALEYLRSNPGPLAGQDLVALAMRVADVIKIGTWQGNDKPRYNASGDKALVDFNFHSGSDRLVHTATFHKIDGVWKLRGARETSQVFEETVVYKLPSVTSQASDVSEWKYFRAICRRGFT
jgi:hypothetical protein